MTTDRGVRRVAVLACGRGHLAVQLALAFPEATVAVFEHDALAVADTRRLVARLGLASRVTVEVGATIRGDDYDVVCARVR